MKISAVEKGKEDIDLSKFPKIKGIHKCYSYTFILRFYTDYTTMENQCWTILISCFKSGHFQECRKIITLAIMFSKKTFLNLETFLQSDELECAELRGK